MTGIILIVIFGVKLHLLPTQGYVSFEDHPVKSLLRSLLPAGVHALLVVAAPILRVLRASLNDVASAPYTRHAQPPARASSTWPEVVLRDVLPNAAIPR